MKKNETGYYNHHGPSMLPTLRPGDGVRVDNDVDNHHLKPGDIIVYHAPGQSKLTAHRIINVEQTGYLTRGDNNCAPDNYTVAAESVVGKVVSVTRGKETIAVSGRIMGLLIHQGLVFKKKCMGCLKPFVFISGIIDNAGVFNRFHPFIKTDVIKIKRRDGCREILIHKKKTIGEKSKQTGKWKIKFPYKYFIDKRCL